MMRSRGATTPTSNTGATTRDREATTSSFVVPIIETDVRGRAAVRQV